MALRDPSGRTRTAVLRAIAANPAAALSLGCLQDWDVVDELVHQACQSCSVPYFRLLLQAMTAYDDPRVVALFVKVAAMSNDTQALAIVRARMAREEGLPPIGSETPRAAAGNVESEPAQTPSDRGEP